MKSISKLLGFIALVVVIGNSIIACSRGGSGDRVVPASDISSDLTTDNRAAPASDFSYDLTTDGRGIVITRYSGRGGTVVIPSTIENLPVLEIGVRTFRNSDSITSIVVPNSVEVIGIAAFASMGNLTSAVLPDGLKVIPGGLFTYSQKLTSVNLPSSLEEIWSTAFMSCSELTDLKIPDSLTDVKFMADGNRILNDNMAFSGCGKLPISTRQRIQSWGYTGRF